MKEVGLLVWESTSFELVNFFIGPYFSFLDRYIFLSVRISRFWTGIFFYRSLFLVSGPVYFFIGPYFSFLDRYIFLSVLISHFWTGIFFYRSVFLVSGPVYFFIGPYLVLFLLPLLIKYLYRILFMELL
ncbi:Uncharacterised protein [Mammaliicoccus sciuri]|nr:Uncharacterised protein [Mammaliicoccus sciuri]